MFSLTIFNPIENIRRGTINYFPRDLKNLLRKIRHGLAHQRIKPEHEIVNGENKFIGVTIKNIFKEYNGNEHTDLEITFTRKQLKEFALFIANEYLKNNP